MKHRQGRILLKLLTFHFERTFTWVVAGCLLVYQNQQFVCSCAFESGLFVAFAAGMSEQGIDAAFTDNFPRTSRTS